MALAEVVANGAAEAAVRQHDEVLVGVPDEMVIDPDLAEFVDENGGIGERGDGQKPLEQRRLAAAEEPGEHDNRDRLRRLGSAHGAESAASSAGSSGVQRAPRASSTLAQSAARFSASSDGMSLPLSR